MKKSLFSSIIKDAGEEHPSIKPYTMKEVPLLGVALVGKDRFPYAHAPGMTDARVGEEQLLKEIEERERYIKQISEKTHATEKEAYEKGFTQGEKAGKELGEKKFEAVVKSFTEVWEEVKRLKEKLYQESEQELVELVLTVARNVIQREISTDRTVIVHIIRSALRYVADQEEIKIRLHPSDLQFASDCKKEMVEGMHKVIFEGDEKIARGNAVIESGRGVIECGIESHLQKLEEALRIQAGTHAPGMGEEVSEQGEDGGEEHGVE